MRLLPSAVAVLLLAAVTAFVISAGLVAYDSWFLRKTRSLR